MAWLECRYKNIGTLIFASMLASSCVDVEPQVAHSETLLITDEIEVLNTCGNPNPTYRERQNFVFEVRDARNPGYRLWFSKDHSIAFISGLTGMCEVVIKSKTGKLNEIESPVPGPYDSSSYYLQTRKASAMSENRMNSCSNDIKKYLARRRLELPDSKSISEQVLGMIASTDGTTPCRSLLEADTRSLFMKANSEVVLVELVSGMAIIGAVQ